MVRATSLSLALICAIGGCGPRSSDSATVSEGRRIDALGNGTFVVGDYRLEDVFAFKAGAPTRLSNLEAVFGPPNRCTAQYTDADVTWAEHGLSGHFTTFGAFTEADGKVAPPDKANACRFRDQIFVSSLRATSKGWHTSTGLTVGDPVDRLLKLYPRALSDGPTKWWLHTFESPYGDAPSEEPDLMAETKDGHVVSISVVIGAQGD